MTKQQQQLVEDNMDLVYFVLHHKLPRFVHNEDLIQAGMLGLCQAAKTYDENRGKFSTYAFKTIHRHICNELTYQNKHQNEDITSLDCVVRADESGKTTLGDLLVGESTAGELDVECADVSCIYDKLSPLDKQILELREQGLSTRQIEKKIGYSRTYVSQRLRYMCKIYKKICGDNND